jgi:hypothetical protein
VTTLIQGRTNESNLASLTARRLTFLHGVRAMPLLVETGLWPAQIKAIENLENSPPPTSPAP